jgi:hypothetical protein
VTPGELTVILVRAQCLEDSLRSLLYRARHGCAWPDHVFDVAFDAQRLESSCARGLGTRGRPYDEPPVRGYS